MSVDKEGRFAGAVLQKGDTKCTVVSVYAPNVDRSKESRQAYVSWLISLRFRIEELRAKVNSGSLIVMGDFNLILDSGLDSFSPSPTVHTIPVQELLAMTEDMDLHDCYRWFNGTKKDYTFKPGGKNVKCILLE